MTGVAPSEAAQGADGGALLLVYRYFGGDPYRGAGPGLRVLETKVQVFVSPDNPGPSCSQKSAPVLGSTRHELVQRASRCQAAV